MLKIFLFLRVGCWFFLMKDWRPPKQSDNWPPSLKSGQNEIEEIRFPVRCRGWVAVNKKKVNPDPGLTGM